MEKKLSELDDNECTLYSDAIDSLQENEDLDEKMTVQKLLETFKIFSLFLSLSLSLSIKPKRLPKRILGIKKKSTIKKCSVFI